MDEVLVSADGWRVERVSLRSGVRLRVTCRGFFVADCLSAAAVAEHVDLATLVPEQLLPPGS